MLNEPIFKIVTLEHIAGQINAKLEIDQRNQIFAGHFPDQPVVPGACMLQLVKETLAASLKTNVALVKADNVKFISLVEPSIAFVQLLISYQQIENSFKVSATLSATGSICMKFQGVFVLT